MQNIFFCSNHFETKFGDFSEKQGWTFLCETVLRKTESEADFYWTGKNANLFF